MITIKEEFEKSIIVHTPTKEEFDKVSKYCSDVLGINWSKGVRRNIPISKTCIRIYNRLYSETYHFYNISCGVENILSTEEFFSNIKIKEVLNEFK